MSATIGVDDCSTAPRNPKKLADRITGLSGWVSSEGEVVGEFVADVVVEDSVLIHPVHLVIRSRIPYPQFSGKSPVSRSLVIQNCLHRDSNKGHRNEPIRRNQQEWEDDKRQKPSLASAWPDSVLDYWEGEDHKVPNHDPLEPRQVPDPEKAANHQCRVNDQHRNRGNYSSTSMPFEERQGQSAAT